MALPALLEKRLKMPVVCAPLFIISSVDLVVAQCKAGVVGSFPALNARPASELDEWLHRITEELAAWDRDNPDCLSAPFAVNQIVHRTNERLEHDMEICARHRVPLIITSLGAREDINRAVHGWGGITLHDVIDDRFARKAVAKGADGLIAVAAGAGGHAGVQSPFALVQEIRQWFDGPLALSGAIASGNAVLAAQAMGADLAYIGSLFIASKEANAVPDYKNMIVEGRASDIVYSNLPTGVHGNYLAPSMVRAGLDVSNLPTSDKSQMDFGKAKAWRDIWGCGQGLGAIDQIQSVRDHLNRIAAEYESAKIALDRRYICQHPLSEPHIRSGNRVRTHALIQERAARAAQGLKELGIGEGDAVALLLRNDFESFEASAAAAMVDSYTVPINWHATAEEVCFILRDCAAKCLIVHRDLLDPLRQALPPELPIIAVATPPEIRAAYNLPAQSAHLEGMLEWEGWIRDHAPLQSSNAARRAAVIYTSGTTGRPKGVRRAPSTVQPNLAPWGLEIDGPVRVLINGPLYHSAPLSFSQACFRKGATIVLQPRFDAEEMLAFVERYQISHMHVVPTMFVRLLRLSDETKLKYDLSSLRYVVHGAAPCPPEIKQAMIAWWGPIISEYYGSTETSLVTWHDSADALRKPGTVGRALPEVEIAILDEHGNRLPQGESGEIFVNTRAGPPFTYIGNDEALAEVSRGSFVTVGDVGFLDQDGFLFLRDRKRDMIISGGVNIYSAEIEAAILTLAGVKDCAVFGIPDPEFGEAVCAHVQPTGDSGLDADTIKRALGERLSRFKIPKVIRIVDSLPREDSGKVFKRKLRELHAPSPM